MRHLRVIQPDRSSHARSFAIVAAVATAAFAGIAWSSASRASAHVDRQVGARLARPRGSRARKAATAIGPSGKWYSQLVVACVIGAAIARQRGTRRSRQGAAAIVASGILAALANKAFDRIAPQPPVPPGRANRKKSVFPSGHTTAPLAVALTAAHVAAREGFVDRRVALSVASAIPLVTASGKLFGRKHWLTDVAGGYAAGIAIAAATLAAYEGMTRGADDV